MRGILNRGFDKNRLDVLECCIHERYQTNLSKTGHNFWCWRGPQVKDWNRDFATIPHNYSLLNSSLGEHQIPPHLDLDCVISGNKAGAFQILSQYAKKYSVPLISVEHTAPHPQWPKEQLRAIKELRGDYNIFISEWSRQAWGWNEDEAEVIHHGIETDLFKPIPEIEKKPYILTTVNEFSKRDWCVGYNLCRQVTEGLPYLNVGNDPPHSKPASSVQELAKFHNECFVFLNTAEYSPFPMSLFEAMSCGSIVVSTASCMIPEVIQHGHNGILTNNPKEMRFYLEDILKNRQNYETLGWNARQTILEKFSLDKFVQKWDNLLRKATA